MSENRDLFYDSQEIWNELLGKGYKEEEIEEAIEHIENTSLNRPGAFWSSSLPVHRTYTKEEILRLKPAVRGYLWRLKCRGVIDHALEDEIITKAINLTCPIGIREIKTVAALTIFGYEHKSQAEKKFKYKEVGFH